MIVFETVTIGLILFASQTVANLCTGRNNGDKLPNPSDCRSFYVCNFGESKLFVCPSNLLFDASKQACNWANMVNCDHVETEHPTISPDIEDQPSTYHEIPTNKPELTPPSPQYNVTAVYPPFTPEIKPPTPSPNEHVVYPVEPEIKPPTPHNETVVGTVEPEIYPPTPQFNETNIVYPGLLQISPNVFHCMDPEFYFAPHPQNCEKYFICENYRIHPHECGEGVYWDYVNNRCNFPLSALCYGKPASSVGKMVCSSGGRTFEYKENECKYVSDPQPTKLPEPIQQFVECPEHQAFLEHQVNCEKYYICINGMPIETSCPRKTAWDNNVLQCNEEAWEKCFA